MSTLAHTLIEAGLRHRLVTARILAGLLGPGEARRWAGQPRSGRPPNRADRLAPARADGFGGAAPLRMAGTRLVKRGSARRGRGPGWSLAGVPERPRMPCCSSPAPETLRFRPVFNRKTDPGIA